MRAREPDREGDRNRDGVRLHDGVFGSGEPTLVLVPSNPIVHSRQWKAQVPTGRSRPRPTPMRRASPTWRRSGPPPARSRRC